MVYGHIILLISLVHLYTHSLRAGLTCLGPRHLDTRSKVHVQNTAFAAPRMGEFALIFRRQYNVRKWLFSDYIGLSNMTQAITPHTGHDLAEQSIFDKAVAIVLDTLSPTSRRVYLRTYRAWTKFANDHSFDVMALTLDNIRAFIHEADVAKTTRQNRLSHMRKLLELLAIGDGHYRQHYNAVKSFLKVQANAGDKARSERVKRALNPHEATALLGVWRNDSSDVGIRNDVMIRLLVYAGLRRSELIALRWTDINVENLTITVRTVRATKSVWW